MGHKIRLWICPCCRATYSRKKYDPVCPYDPCSLCGIPYCKAIKYPSPNYYSYKCKHRKKRESAAKFKRDYYRKPRNLGGQVLKISSETMKAFRSLQKSKRYDSFERRTNIFLKLLYKDMNNYPDHSYRRYIDKDSNIKKCQGGIALIPVFKIRWSKTYYNSHHNCMYQHIYRRADFIRVFQINLSIKGYRSFTKEDVCRDLFYFICDWICSMFGLSHSKDYRHKWFKWFSKKLNINGGVK